MVEGVGWFVAEADIPFVSFGRGQGKEDLARPYQLAAEAEGAEGGVLVGVAQEKLVGGWPGQRHGGSDTHPHFAFRRAQMYVNHYYFYLWDDQWGPAFIKMCPLPGVGVPERPRVAEAAPGRHRRRLRPPRQRPVVL